MTDVAPHCPRCGSNRMRDNRELRHSAKGPDYVCVESNCQGVLFAPQDPYDPKNNWSGMSENVYTISGGVLTHVGDATKEGGDAAKEQLTKEMIAKARIYRRDVLGKG